MEKFYPPYLFTYGTLMRRFDNPFAQKLRQEAAFEGPGSMRGQLYKIDWYPGALHDEKSNARVYGEVFRLHSPDILIELDEYEDVFEDEAASLYLRKVVLVEMENRGPVSCWTYLYNQPVNPANEILSGRFEG